MTTVLKSLGVHLSENEVEKLVVETGEGHEEFTVELLEKLVAEQLHPGGATQIEELEEAFKVFDKDQDG